MLEVRWTEEAVLDFAEIIGYIEERDPLASSRLYDDIVQATGRLGRIPYLYRPGRVQGTRELVVRPSYVVVYRIHDGAVDVLRILHARQQYP